MTPMTFAILALLCGCALLVTGIARALNRDPAEHMRREIKREFRRSVVNRRGGWT